MKSRKLKDFINEIQYVNRNPKDNSVLSLLDEMETNPKIIINNGESLFRGRIIQDKNQINKGKNFWGYGLKDSFIPPIEKTMDMRANYRYIPYLYCSNNRYIAVVETRPRYNSEVSVASILVNEKLKLLDFTMQSIPAKMTETKKNLFDDLSELFAKPVADTNNVLDYIPTQYIAEYAKSLDYAGIAYKSSLISNDIQKLTNEMVKRFNIVIFNYNKCLAISSNIYRITNLFIECEQIDEDTKRIYIPCPVDEALSEILK